MAEFANARNRGQSIEQAIGRNPVWSRRRAKVVQALERHPGRFWLRALSAVRGIDRIAKGAAAGEPWNALTVVCTRIAGLAALPFDSL